MGRNYPSCQTMAVTEGPETIDFSDLHYLMSVRSATAGQA